MLTQKQKKEIVKKLSEGIEKSQTTMICDYKGMTVPEISELRNELRKNSALMQVAKKTLIQIAFKKIDSVLDPRNMDGQLAVVYGGENEISSPKVLYEYSEKNEKLKILAGILDGKVLSVEDIEDLAKLPSKEELLAKIVGSISSPISGFVNVLAGNARNFVCVLNAIRESKESAVK
ncbi:MAG: 50S ribosomal protein L10 [Patescibacteria group bacterium]|nr:50S ribosomal protein L10 [Patescibacteria group bacterium]